MNAPYFRLFIENSLQEITDLVESFRYEDSMNEDDLLELRLSVDLSTSGDFSLNPGTELLFNYGYLGGTRSLNKSARITDVDFSYSNKVSVVIKALDLGNVMKKTSSRKVWKGVSSRDIVKEIAAKYGLTAIVDGATQIWNSLPQGNYTDFDFLQQLAAKERSGNYICYISSKELRFVRRGLDKRSSKTFIYGVGNEVLYFKPTLKDSSKPGSSSSTSLLSVSPETKSEINNTASDTDEAESITLGNFKTVYNSIGDVVGGIGIPVPVDEEENTNRANHLKKKKTLEAFKANLKVVGSPNIQANDIITVLGVLKAHRGNYLITKVVHSINNSGFTSELHLTKNGTELDTAVMADSANVKDSASDARSVSLNTYSANGDLLNAAVDDLYQAP